jgi:putative spermidine/putrescine transport system permease protein
MFCGLVLVFLVLPLAVVVPLSFSAGAYLQFPPPGYSFRWYQTYFGDPQWMSATVLSAEVGLTVVVISLVLGVAAALGIVRFPIPGKTAIRVILMSPLIIPTVVIAIAVYSEYVALHLIGNFWGLVVAHTILALPFTVMMSASGLERVDRRLEEASYTMGATALQTFKRVTLPIIAPSLFAAGIFAFITSWDEVIMVLFVGGATATTLPLKMFSYLRTEINPTIAAVSTLLLVVVLVTLLSAEARSFGRVRPVRRLEASIEDGE